MTTGVITFENLTKHFGRVHAVQDFSATVQPGRVTGFLGPNGSGKTTSLRCLLGLARPSGGMARFDGRTYEELPDPVGTVGAALEATAFYPSRRARDHVLMIADAAGLPGRRADEVLDIVGLTPVKERRAGGFSLGMRQRLALAVALLGDPQFLVLDEPANGLDPAGIAWLRGFLRYLAGQGRTILVSSHVLAEIQQTAEDVVIINRGSLVVAEPLAALETKYGSPSVHVLTLQPELLHAALVAQFPDALVQRDAGGLRVRGISAADVGSAAFRAGVELQSLTAGGVDLEQLFLNLTADPGAAA